MVCSSTVRRSAGTWALLLLSAFFFLFPVSRSAAESAGVSVPLDVSSINSFDRLLMFPYSEGPDLASEFTQYASWLAPAVFMAVSPPAGWIEIGLLYAGSTALSFGTRTVLKSVVDRDRPYMYFADPLAEGIESGDSRNSFPSGHTTMAFTGAAFAATLFALRYPNSPYRISVTAAAFALAGTTAALRVASGNHFMSDVLAGAAIGSLSGFIVPFAYSKIADACSLSDVTVSVTPFGFSVGKKL